MNKHRQKLYDYLTGDTHIKLSRRERAKCRRMQERRANRMRVHWQRVYFSCGIKRSDGRYEFTPQPVSYYGSEYASQKQKDYWGMDSGYLGVVNPVDGAWVEAAHDDCFALKC